MTALLALTWPLTVALAYLLGRRHGAVLVHRLYAEERGVRLAKLANGWWRRRGRVVVDVEMGP